MVRLTIRVPAKIGSPWAHTKSQSWCGSVSNRTVLMVRIGMGKR